MLNARPALALRLLGGFRCTVHGRPVEGINYNTMRALLAYLAVEPAQDHSREALAELLWSGKDAVTARGNLRRTLSDLRRVLEPLAGTPLFAVDRHTIRLSAPAEVDVRLFTAPVTGTGAPHQHNAQRVALYGGEFLAGFHLPDNPDFGQWLQVQREALRRRALALLEQLANFHEPLGDPAQALPFALRYLALAPWDESAHRRVMRLYALAGQPAAALGQFDACRQVLQTELGLAPGAETLQLAERIRARHRLDGWSQRPAEAARPEPPALPAGRRQVSILVCEMQLRDVDDPDDAIEVLAPARSLGAGILQRLHGHLVPMQGGALMAYFGYPQARENSAVHAVQAALDLVRQTRSDIRLRVAIHTGMILTGPDALQPDVIGATSAIAVHLLRCIGADGVAVSQATHALVDGHFTSTPLGPHTLPDVAQPLEVFRIERARGACSRLEAAAQRTPLVGRRAELERLMALWQAARPTTARLVLVHGDAGIGKSRLVHVFRQQIAGQAHAERTLRCFPEYSHSPWHPVLVLLADLLGFSPADSPEQKTRRLVQAVMATDPARAPATIPLLADLYGLPPAQGFPAPVPAAGLQRQRVGDLLGTLLLGPPQAAPLLLVVEDLHWADASTLELLRQITRPGNDRPLLAVFTARPGMAPPFEAEGLPLAPLAESEIGQLIADVRPDLPAEARLSIVARADGVPLFAEELARAATPGNGDRIPGTLHDLLVARIDQLGTARHTACMAAAIGREFRVDLLRKLTAPGTDTLAQALDLLHASGLIVRVDAHTCQFRHALIQEAAYQSQTRADRQATHQRLADLLQADYPELTASHPELLARHQAGAGLVRQAIASWTRAGQRAAHASAHREAVAHYRAALQLLMTLPATAERDQKECAILVGLGLAMHTSQGYGSEEASRIAMRVSILRGALADHTERFQAEWTRLRNRLAAHGPRGVPQAAIHLLQLAGEDPVSQQAAHYVAAMATFWLGEFEASRGHAARALALYGPHHHTLMLERFGEDLSVSYAGHLSWALCFLGQTDEAQAVRAHMFQQARRMQHPKTLAMALLFATMLSRWLNQHAQTLSLATETLALTRQHGMVHWAATSAALQSWAEVLHAGRRDVVELAAVAAASNAQAPAYAALRHVGLAEMLMHLGRFEEASGQLRQAQAAEAATGCCPFAAETLRLQGACLLARQPPDPDAAAGAFAQALALSQRQGARMLALRAADSLAQLQTQHGPADNARHLLAQPP